MSLLVYPIQAISIGGRRFGADYVFPRHVQTRHQFYAVLEGRVSVEIEERRVLLKAGEALWMAPVLRRSPRAAGPRGRYLNVTFDSPWPELGAKGEKVTLGQPALSLATECADLAGSDEHEQAAGFHALCFQLLGAKIFSRRAVALRQTEKPQDGVSLVNHLEQFMRANVSHPLGIDDMGSLVNASRSTLVRLFRRHRRDSPAACFRRIRLEYGQELLRTSSMTVTQVALETGFSSSQHFATAYRQHFGHSPSSQR